MAKKKTTKPKPPAPPLYAWDGGKAVHSIPQGVHNQNVQARGYGIDLNSSPLARPAFAGAYGQAAAEFAPQIQAQQQVGVNAQPYFQDYINRTMAQQTAANTYAQPILDQANAWANQAPSAAPGLDSNSSAYGASQQASTSGQSLAKLGADTVAAIPLTTTGYLTGQANIAAGQIPVAQNYAAQQVAGLKGQQAAKTVGYYGTNLQNAQNADIAYKTLDVNANNTAADNAYQVANAQQQAADKKAARVVSRKNTQDRVNATTQGQQTAADKAAAKEKAAKDKATAKKNAAVDKATGAVKSKVTDIIGVWDGGGTVEDTTKPADVVTGKYPSRKATPAELRQIIISKYGYLGRIALAVKAGKPLDQKAIDYLKQKYPDIQVPREWLSKTPAQDKNPHGTSQAPTKAPKAHGHI